MQSFLSSLISLFSSCIVQIGTKSIKGISTDSRSTKEEDLFIALVGDKFDGHHFIPHLLEQVSAIVISQDINIPYPKEITVFKVQDTLVFYQQIAKNYLLTKPNLKKIAITGSAGKTSTKEWLALLLTHQYKTYKTFANFNNLVGVPKSILEIQDEQIAIFELGTGKPGDISILTDIIKPNTSIVTSIGEAHLEFFEHLENIALEKASICINQNCYTTHNIPFAQTIFKNFTHIDPDKVFDSILDQNIQGFKLILQGQEFIFPFFGYYNLTNFSLAVTIALSYGITPYQIAQTSFNALPSYRSKIVKKNNALLILDCYNANPLSMKESIASMNLLNPKPILVLGDMLELGKDSYSLHQNLGEYLNQSDFDMIFFIGEGMQKAFEVYTKQGFWSKTLLELAEPLQQELLKDQYIFVKGSRGMHLEDIENL